MLLKRFVGVGVELAPGAPGRVELELVGDGSGRRVCIADGLFETPEETWLHAACLPAEPVPRWVPPAWTGAFEALPVLYGAPLPGGQYLAEAPGRLELGIDVFGSAFHQLSRLEEHVSAERDHHERFPASASLACREGFLGRALVNELGDLLAACFERLWPGFTRRRRGYRLLLSHDVDWPWMVAGRPLPKVLKSALGDLWQGRGPSAARARLAAFRSTRGGNYDADPGNTFDWLMELSEARGLASAFYFISGHGPGEIDGVYDLRDPWIHRLLRRIDDRGHEIGLHPSYGSFRSPATIRHELDQLRETCAGLGIARQSWGGRQHYLRWQNPVTWQGWEDAGLTYDSTLGFSDRAGFRCGSCYPYPVFNLETRRALALEERPLIVMEVTLRQYLGLSWAAAREAIAKLAAVCRGHGGDFTLLWHNSSLLGTAERRAYAEALEAAAP